MGWNQELKDFMSALQTGQKIIGAKDDREYKQARTKYLNAMTQNASDPEMLSLKKSYMQARTGAVGSSIGLRKRALDLQEKGLGLRERYIDYLNKGQNGGQPDSDYGAVGPRSDNSDNSDTNDQTADAGATDDTEKNDTFDTADASDDTGGEGTASAIPTDDATNDRTAAASRGGLVKRYASGGLSINNTTGELTSSDAAQELADLQTQQQQTAQEVSREHDKQTATAARGGLVKKYEDGGEVDEDEDSSDDSEDTSDEEMGATSQGNAPQYSRQAAYDAIADGMGYLQQQRQMAQGQQQGAIPADGSTTDMSARSRGAGYPSGPSNGALGLGTRRGQQLPVPTRQEVNMAMDAIDEGHNLPDSERAMAALGAVYQFKMSHGDLIGAKRAAAGMLEYFRETSGRYRAIAKAAAEGGDLDLAAKAAVKAYANIPDGKDIKLSKNSDGTINYKIVEDGKELGGGVIKTPQEIANAAVGADFDSMIQGGLRERANTHNPDGAPKLQDRDKAVQDIQTARQAGTDGQKSPYPAGADDDGDFIASDILRGNNIGRGYAVKATTALLDPNAKVQVQPQEDGGAIIRAPGSQIPIRVSRNAFMQAMAIRGQQQKAQYDDVGKRMEGMQGDVAAAGDAAALAKPYQNTQAARSRFNQARRGYATQDDDQSE